MRKTDLLYIVYFFLIAYLLINTGIFSDEFGVILRLKDKTISDILFCKSSFFYIDIPAAYITHYIWYYFFRHNYLLIDILKICYIMLCFYLIAQFFTIFLNKYTSLWASFLFIFFPTHDSTVYCFMIQYLTISFAFYLYSFYLAYHNKMVLAFVSALFASFMSYGSTPIAVALFILFALNKEFKKGACIIIPNIIYALYFITFNIVMRLGTPRIIEKFSIGAVIKQFVLQILTFIDSMLGSSMWLKIYYGFWQLSLISFAIGLAVIIAIYRMNQEEKARYNSRLIISLSVMLFCSFLMFAVTGRYPQLAFNLGNRTTIYGSLLLTYLIVLIPVSKKIRTLGLALMVFTVLGISDHWKSWNLHQQKVIANIKSNQNLKNYHDNKFIYVSGNQYSNYGPLSHIEFFSENWVPNSIFKLALGKDIIAVSINKRYRYMDGYIIDTKYNQKEKIEDYINIYDSDKNILFKLKAEEINSYIDSLPADNRHWIQIVNIKFLKGIVNILMPRLKYAL